MSTFLCKARPFEEVDATSLRTISGVDLHKCRQWSPPSFCSVSKICVQRRHLEVGITVGHHLGGLVAGREADMHALDLPSEPNLGGDGRQDTSRTPVDNFRGFRAQNQHVIDTDTMMSNTIIWSMSTTASCPCHLLRHLISEGRCCTPH